MTKISENFVVQEFVSKETYTKWGDRSIWFVSNDIVNIAEFYKRFFTAYFKKKYPELFVVLIKVNDWHVGGSKNWRGYRTPECTEGAKESQHRFCKAFDCDINLKFKDGSIKEADYKEIQQIIKDNWPAFRDSGLTTIEDVAFAPTWLHSDIRNTNSNELLIVKP